MVLKCSMILGCQQHLENGDGVWQMRGRDIIQDWSQTQALLGCRQNLLWGLPLPYLENCFFLFVMKLKFQYLCMHYVCSIFLVRKLARPLPEAQLLFKGKQRGFWRQLLVRDQIKEGCPQGLQWKKYFRILLCHLSESLLLYVVHICGLDSLV